MTTDLTGDFELGEDEFDWDVFVPDPDEAEREAEAAALEDEAELNLDDSHFDWERALGEDSESESRADGAAAAGAAYDRIVDTVRRSFEDSEPEAHPAAEADVAAQADLAPDTTQPAPVAFGESGLSITAEPEEAGLSPAFEPVEDPDDEPVSAIEPDSDAKWEREPERLPAAVFPAEPELEAEPAAEAPERLPEFEHVRWLDQDSLVEQEPEPEVTVGSEDRAQPFAPEFAEAAATVGVVSAMEPATGTSSKPGSAWAMAPAEPWDVDRGAEPASDPVDASVASDRGGKPKRSRVFKATVVLACLFLLIVAGAVARQKLRPGTTTPAPAHVAAPASSSSAPSSSRTSASSVARIQAATGAVNSATTAANVGITSLAAFPTPTNVEGVVNPYVSSLQLYETFLTGTDIPAAAQPAAASAEAQLRQDLSFLDTIDGLPPQQLGAFLVQFDTDTAHLQTTLSTLEQNLRATPS